MKIVDSFIFYNELDLLEYRLSILDPFVDFFILVESTHTFSGHPKVLFYQENKDRFERFNRKIIHIIVHDLPFKYPNIRYEYNQQWQNEYHQRNCIQNGIELLKLEPDDLILTSDVDEIPNPKILENAKNDSLVFDREQMNRLALDMYYYNLHYRIGEGSNWHGIKLLTFSAYVNNRLSFQEMRVWEHSHFVPVVKNGGWHLSYFGDIDFIIKKIDSFSHQEYNNSEYLDKEKLEEKMKKGINLLNNSNLVYIPLEENTNLPFQYERYLKKFYIQ
jgi:beta-1,4-mannosyl-glycoprotein beta-1,4-N-acetylglucosaminyltransferase